jgi:hypothetical protein
VYEGTTVGRPERVWRYRYPDNPSGVGLPRVLAGPEQAFRATIPGSAANFGVVILSRSARSDVTPRIVRGADENRLAGYPALPLVTNPYLDRFYKPEPVAAVLIPGRGTYTVVFDSPSRSTAGSFSFRYWVDDRDPPAVTELSPGGSAARFSVTDAGSGVDPVSVGVTVDGTRVPFSFSASSGVLSLPRLEPGTHTVVVEAADYQETKNNENVGPVLPNTRTFTATFLVR